MSCESIQLLKRVARGGLRERIAELSATQRTTASAALVTHMLRTEVWQRAKGVLLFRALDDEPSLDALARDALARGTMLAMPRIETDGRMTLRRVESLREDAWDIDACGIQSPNGVEIDAAQFDFIAVPGVGFAPDGARVGRGKGYYDRLLASLPNESTTVGIAFACQILNRLPTEPHDARVQWIATEDGVFRASLT